MVSALLVIRFLSSISLNNFTSRCRTLILMASLSSWQVSAETLILPPTDVDLVGRTGVANARQEDTLLDIARRFDVGQDEIVLANPEVDRWLPGEGTKVVVPTRYILPHAARTGIVLNVP